MLTTMTSPNQGQRDKKKLIGQFYLFFVLCFFWFIFLRPLIYHSIIPTSTSFFPFLKFLISPNHIVFYLRTHVFMTHHRWTAQRCPRASNYEPLVEPVNHLDIWIFEWGKRLVILTYLKETQKGANIGKRKRA